MSLDDTDAVGSLALPTSDEYRQAMGRLVTGVTVVTTRAGGLEHAMTANAVSSASLEPLLLLVCVEREARFHDAIIEAGVWAVNILPGSARSAADWLATRGRPLHGQLDRVAHHPGPRTGVPLLDVALSSVECHTTELIVVGDHTIVVGEVLSVEIAEHATDALVYYRGRYDTLS